ncbi:hypothetical protein K2173_020131 [Erythroxylum novogranatense]|uniref:non-specific serine/threonine protein kinase n=1 Tax=Erythroxylum novogranatense TaxID=1862640 RepID=A0AAV8U707_9ROSI|nr:hypothetical protein K2173_020131 [Erythroxylum novogranatense]
MAQQPMVWPFAGGPWKNNVCSSCLSQASSSAVSCLPAEEARVLNTGCFLRYSSNPFANDSSLETKDETVCYVLYINGMAAFCLVAIGLGVYLGRLVHIKRHCSTKPEGTSSYATLEAATENFNQVHRLRRGGFGEVYKGTLPDGREIAIKRLLIGSGRRIEKICSEMEIISKAQHKNLVHSLGCCFTNSDSFLIRKRRKNSIGKLKKLLIIIGTAEGLEYLHNDCQFRIIHRDIKASNIVLDLKLRPKISDFGPAKFCSSLESHTDTAIAGTIGYMAPKYIAKGRLTEKVDVYSFGILVLEIVTGIENTKFQYTWKHFQSKAAQEIVDKSIVVEHMEEVERVVQIGLLCTQESPSSRPTMAEVVQMLRKNELELPRPTSPPFTGMNMELRSLSSDGQGYSMAGFSETQNSRDK